MPRKPPPKEPEAPDLDAFLAEMKTQFAALGKQFKQVADQVGEEAQFHFDKELARALAKHPELYAEVRKTIRQVQKTVDKAAETLGFKDT
jgi:F0F1-type ATP synthase membrane subunit b/b'